MSSNSFSMEDINKALESAIRQARLLATKSTTYTDKEALSLQILFPIWPEGVNEEGNYVEGQYVQHKGLLYRIMQPVVMPIETQPPDAEGMLAVYRPADVEHSGTREDPIPWVYGMNCYKDKYYSYEGGLYLCTGNMFPCTWYPGQPGVHQWEKVD